MIFSRFFYRPWETSTLTVQMTLLGTKLWWKRPGEFSVWKIKALQSKTFSWRIWENSSVYIRCVWNPELPHLIDFRKSAIAPNNCICFIKTVYSRSECERDAGHDQHKHDRETLQEPTGFNQETSETHSQYYISHNYFTEYTQHIHKNHNFDSWKTFLKTTNNIYKIFLVFKKI